jgi:hypothetical protein
VGALKNTGIAFYDLTFSFFGVLGDIVINVCAALLLPAPLRATAKMADHGRGQKR